MRWAFVVVSAAWFAMMAATNLATPLYAIYEREFDFSSAVLTLVFATYALVLAPSLLVFGQLSDRLGRRRVMAAGYATVTAGLALFAVAPGLPWLFAARAVQGLAVGMISGAAAAALVELDPAPQEDRAALFAALAQAGGSGSGPPIAGMLAEWAPAPLVLPFAIFIILGIAATIAALAIPEPNPAAARARNANRLAGARGARREADGAGADGASRETGGAGADGASRETATAGGGGASRAAGGASREAGASRDPGAADGASRDAGARRDAGRAVANSPRRLVQRPGVPAKIRTLFARASVTGALVWSAAAIFLSVVPSYAADLLDTSNLALLGAISGLVLGASCVAQIFARRSHAHARMQAAGLVLLATGLLALVLAFPAHSLVVLLVAAILAGTGHGIAFLGSQAQLNAAAPPDRRGEVNAAFYTLIYLGVAIAVISTGLLTLEISLAAAVSSYAVVAGAIALLTALWHLRPVRATP